MLVEVQYREEGQNRWVGKQLQGGSQSEEHTCHFAKSRCPPHASRGGAGKNQRRPLAQGLHSDRVSITDLYLLVPQHLELDRELPFEEGEMVSYQLPGKSEPAV